MPNYRDDSKMTRRALLIVLDSVGIGGAPDAAQYGDEGANTQGHILERQPDLRLPALWSLGLGRVLNTNDQAELMANVRCGRLREESAGKDTTTGHWELMGVLLEEPFTVFERFPPELVTAIEAECDVRFIGNYAQSGTKILEELGEEHLQSGHPILYTSADSVMQIAAHEDVVSVERLYEICRAARRLCDPFRIGRVIARPFVGQPENFQRTPRRHDFSMQPPRTVLNALQDAGAPTIGIGKISDIFNGSGISQSHPTTSNADGMRAIEDVWAATESGLVFANLVDFDMLFGHRRDVSGYADALRQFDDWLSGFLPRWNGDDLLLITADHGNDPTAPGSNHTREETPLLMKGAGCSALSGEKALGTRRFVDVAATLAQFFPLPQAWPVGSSLL